MEWEEIAKVSRFVVMKGDVIHAYLGQIIIAIQNNLEAFHHELRKLQERVTDSTQRVNKIKWSLGNNDIDHIIEQVLTSLDGRIEVTAATIVQNLSWKAESGCPDCEKTICIKAFC